MAIKSPKPTTIERFKKKRRRRSVIVNVKKEIADSDSPTSTFTHVARRKTRNIKLQRKQNTNQRNSFFRANIILREVWTSDTIAYIASIVIPQQFIVTVLNVCVNRCVCVGERARENVLIEINDYYGIFFRRLSFWLAICYYFSLSRFDRFFFGNRFAAQ